MVLVFSLVFTYRYFSFYLVGFDFGSSLWMVWAFFLLSKCNKRNWVHTLLEFRLFCNVWSNFSSNYSTDTLVLWLMSKSFQSTHDFRSYLFIIISITKNVFFNLSMYMHALVGITFRYLIGMEYIFYVGSYLLLPPSVIRSLIPWWHGF